MPARTGEQYLAGLAEAREIWLDGARVPDVRTHPALRRGVASVARLYDMQYDPALSNIMTYPSPTTGELVGTSFMIPRTLQDLVQRRQMMQHWANATCGMMGRTPDFLNVSMMAFALWRDYFGEKEPIYGQNVWNYYEYIREHDLCLTHTLVSPQIDRSKPVSEWADPYLMLGVVRETSAGLTVRGARMLATLAPMADELAVYPSTVKKLLPAESRYALMFAIPVATPGLVFISREGVDRGASHFDHPLASRFEEMDCVVVFNDVLVPWERVFLYGDVERHNSLFPNVNALGHVTHQVGVKNIAKTAFLVGLACRLAEMLGRQGELHIQEMLGELISYLETVQALVIAAEVQATPGPMESLMPARDTLFAMRTLYPRLYPRMVEILQAIGGPHLVMTLSQADLQNPMAARLAPYVPGAHGTVEERMQLLRLAWDVAGDTFGGRQTLYERLFAGDPVRNMANRYLSYDTTACQALVSRLLADTSNLAYMKEGRPAGSSSATASAEGAQRPSLRPHSGAKE
jgi:4-hydroxyphenylacetate 3-monooxygenase